MRGNAALSLSLSLALMTSASPVTAQEQTETSSPPELRSTTGPIARAASREAFRLAATTSEPITSTGENAERRLQPALSDWLRVRQLWPPTELAVTVKGASPVRRYFLASDNSELLVLDGADPALSPAAKELLQDAASSHELRNSASADPFLGWAFKPRERVVLQSDGVYVGRQKVAELSQIEHIARSDVTEINVLAKPSLNSILKWPALIGLGVGLVTATVWYKGYCGSHSCDSQEPLVFFLYPTMGAALGVGVGAVIWAGHEKTPTEIYRAP